MNKHNLQFYKSFKNLALFCQAYQTYLLDEIKFKLKLEILEFRQSNCRFIRNLIIMQYDIKPKKDLQIL